MSYCAAKARAATTLRSQQGQAVITLSGDGAGLEQMTLDGENLVSNSIGVYGENRDRVVFRDVTVKRFDTGIKLKGGLYCEWVNLSVSKLRHGRGPAG